MTHRFLNGLTAEGKIISTVAEGTPPIEVASSTQVDNLNAAMVGGIQPNNIVKTDGSTAMTGQLQTPSVKIGGGFEMGYNATTKTLSFNFVG